MADRPAPAPDPATSLSIALAERDAWAQALFESERFAAQLAIERQHLTDALDAAHEREAALAALDPLVDAARRERDQARADCERVTAERDAMIAERDGARADAHDARAMLDRVTASTAWRLTGPVRRVLQAVLGR